MDVGRKPVAIAIFAFLQEIRLHGLWRARGESDADQVSRAALQGDVPWELALHLSLVHRLSSKLS
jgi:hypothetical protein